MSTQIASDGPDVALAFAFDRTDPERAEQQLGALEEFLVAHDVDLGRVDRDDPDDDLCSRSVYVPLLAAVSLLEELLHAGLEPVAVVMATPETYPDPDVAAEARALVELCRAAEVRREPAATIDEVFEAHANAVEAYRAGETSRFGFLLGQVIAGASCRLDARLVNAELQHRLS